MSVTSRAFRNAFIDKNRPLRHLWRNSMSRRWASDNVEPLKAVVGLEIHAQINAKSKLFSASSAKYGTAPNTQVSFFDAALPGTLPVVNRYCVEAAVKTALSFGCKVNKRSSFDRKHYFYADMPAGYQITQYRHPIATGGEVEYVIYVRGRHKVATTHKVRLHQIQLEQDSGKSIHDGANLRSLVDLNRAGVGLMEIVTEPDFEDGEQAAAFVRELRDSLRRINTCDGRMEQGGLRVDANVSVHLPDRPYGVRTEVKNLNSIKSVQQAIDYEVERQKKLVTSGGEVINETMSFDTSSRRTVPMRDKERLQDYRFMAEPNLPPIILSDVEADKHTVSINSMRSQLPELLPNIRRRLVDYGLKLEHALTVLEFGLLDTIEEMLELSTRDPREVIFSMFKFLTQIVVVCSGERKCSMESLLSNINSSQLLQLWKEYENRTITSVSCRNLIHRLLDDNNASVSSLLASGEFTKIVDVNEMKKYCHLITQQAPEKVDIYLKKRKEKDLKELLTLINESSGHRMNNKDLAKVLRSYLDSLPTNS